MNLFLLAAVVCLITWILYVPFIGLLYRLKLREPSRESGRKDRFGDSKTVAVFDRIKGHKIGTPIGGGVLIVFVTLLVFFGVSGFKLYSTHPAVVLLFAVTTLAFGFLGLYDDLKKIFKFKGLALRVRHKFVLQVLVAYVISDIGISSGLFFVRLPFSDAFLVSSLLLYIVSILTIVFMSNAFNILDGVDGLSAGSLLITLVLFGVLLGGSAAGMTPFVFICILFGATLAFLYFNASPARLFMGDTGALAFGAILGVLVMMSGTFFLLPVYGIVYIADALSSLVQWVSKYFRKGKGVFKIAPVHHHFEAIGWPSTKVVFRFWIIHAFASLLAVGLYLNGF